MEPAPDLLMAGIATDMSQSIINAAAPTPLVLTRVYTNGAGGLFNVLKRTAFQHSGVCEISPKPDSSAPGIKSLVWHTFYSGANIMGCLSLWENRQKESKGWVWDAKYCQLTLMARYWGIISECQDYSQLQEEARLVRASAKRWEADCLAEATRSARLAAECHEAQAQLAAQQTALDSLRSDVHNYIERFNSIQEDFNNTISELTVVKATLADTENELFHATKEIERLRHVANSEAAALDSAKDEIGILKRALADYGRQSMAKPKQDSPKNAPIAVGSLASQILAFDRGALKHVN